MATGHHAGGIVKALELIRARNGGTAVPFFMHPGMFRRRALQLPTGDILPFNDVPTAAELTEKGAAVKSTDQPALALEDMFYVSGEIPRVTQYEHGLPNQVRRTEDGSGWEPDPLIMDERFLTVHIPDKGLLIFSACSHAGLINVLTEARRLFPEIPLYGVMGGFHLSGSGLEKIIPETLRELADFDVRWIIPCHCTGWRAVMALVQAFGEERVVPGAVGQRFAFWFFLGARRFSKASRRIFCRSACASGTSTPCGNSELHPSNQGKSSSRISAEEILFCFCFSWRPPFPGLPPYLAAGKNR